MKRAWWALVAAATILGTVVVSCSSSNGSSLRVSQIGESCTRSSDCATNLVCLDGTCFAKVTTVVTGQSPGDAGGDIDAPVTGVGGGPQQLGQACSSTTSCTVGLTCVPFPSSVGGLCDYTTFPVPPADAGTGKTCTGECISAADCCELPLSLGSVNVVITSSDGGQDLRSVPENRCPDILAALGGDLSGCTPPDGSTLDPGISALCLVYESYCSCAAGTWACTNNSCEYTGACTVGASTNELGSCANMTRSSRTLALTCIPGPDAGATTGSPGSCAPAGCIDSASCDGQTVADPGDLDGIGTTCTLGDCTCYQSQCYFTCTRNVDCTGGYACDATTSLCTRVAHENCTTDGQCVAALGVTTAVCAPDSTCRVKCISDHDCSLSSGAVPALGPFSGQVCSAAGYCTAVPSSAGCASNNDCLATAGGALNMFCVAPQPTVNVQSAITSGGGDAGP
jgi:hypothetical protein